MVRHETHIPGEDAWSVDESENERENHQTAKNDVPAKFFRTLVNTSTICRSMKPYCQICTDRGGGKGGGGPIYPSLSQPCF